MKLNMEWFQMYDLDAKFLLGICCLLGWAIVMLLCATPQLFRDRVMRLICCKRKDEELQMIKIKEAQERVRSASKSLIATSMVQTPSQILLHQAMAPAWAEPIPEDLEDARSQPESLVLIEPTDPRCPAVHIAF